MIMVGIGVVLFAYAAGMWGYCLLRGYCVTPANIMDWNYPAKLAGTTSASTAPAAPSRQASIV